MTNRKIEDFNGASKLHSLLTTLPMGEDLGLQLVHVLEPVFFELISEARSEPPERFRINAQDKALFELFRDMRNIQGFFLDYEDYRVHLERTVGLAKQLLDRGITDVTKLEGYAEHMEELRKFYLEIQQNPKYRDQFKEFPRGN